MTSLHAPTRVGEPVGALEVKKLDVSSVRPQDYLPSFQGPDLRSGGQEPSRPTRRHRWDPVGTGRTVWGPGSKGVSDELT